MAYKWLRMKEVAYRCGISIDWLADHRADGKGPPYHMRAGKVCYDEAEIDAWIESQRRPKP